MGYFPFYMDIEGKLCVIAGGGKVAYRKVCDLLPFGPCIRVISKEFNAELEALGKDASRTQGRLQLNRRLFSMEDIKDADFVIAALSDEALNSQISAYCKENRIPVNVVDVKDKCSFIFPAMIKRGPVTVAVSSGGASPVFTRLLKERIKQVLPKQTEGIADQLGSLRQEIFSLFPDSSKKRAAVFTELAELALDQEKTLKEDQIRQIILKYKINEELYDRTYTADRKPQK